MDANVQVITPGLNEIKTVLDLYATQYSATDKLWAYFSSVTLAVLGLTVASDKVSKSFAEASMVALGYLVFCAGNFSALRLSHLQLVEFSELARRVAASHKTVLASLQPMSIDAIQLYYWLVATAVVSGILLITWKRSSKAGASDG